MPRNLPASRPSVADHLLDVPETSLLDVLDHVLNKGIMATGDVTLGVAGVDLIYLRLSALLCSTDRVFPRRSQRTAGRSRRRAFPRMPR